VFVRAFRVTPLHAVATRWLQLACTQHTHYIRCSGAARLSSLVGSSLVQRRRGLLIYALPFGPWVLLRAFSLFLYHYL